MITKAAVPKSGWFSNILATPFLRGGVGKSKWFYTWCVVAVEGVIISSWSDDDEEWNIGSGSTVEPHKQ